MDGAPTFMVFIDFLTNQNDGFYYKEIRKNLFMCSYRYPPPPSTVRPRPSTPVHVRPRPSTVHQSFQAATIYTREFSLYPIRHLA